MARKKKQSFKPFDLDPELIRKKLLETMMRKKISVYKVYEGVGVSRQTLINFLKGKPTSFKALAKYVSWIEKNILM